MSSSPSTQFAWLKKFAEENPFLLLWNAVLFLGGLILLTYHARLLYLPDFSLSDLAGLMASVTFIGLFFVAFYLMSSFFPGLTLRWIENDWKLFPYRGYFSSPKQKLILFALPIVLWGSYLSIPEAWRKEWPFLGSPPLFFSFILLASFMTAGLMAHSSGASMRVRILKHPPFWRDVTGLFLWTFLFFFPIELSVSFATNGETDSQTLSALGAVVLLAIFNVGVHTAPKGKLRHLLVMGGLVTVLLIPIMSGQSLFFPQSIMQLLSLGHRNAATLTISGKNCHTLARLGVPCSDNDVKDGSIELENVNILSRVGTSVLVELLVQAAPEEKAEPAQGKEPQPAIGKQGVLTITSSHRRLYCSTSPKAADTCSSCEALLMQHASLGGTPDGSTLPAYRKSLVCVQLSIPKDQMLNMSLGGKRRYSDYSGYSLLDDAKEKKEDAPPAK